MFELALLIMAVLGVVLNGFALKILWGWFITTTFGIHPLTLVQAIGLSMVVSFLTSGLSQRSLDDDERMYVATSWVVRPIIALFIGFIINLFM